jgi:mitochondrial fission process protein 1
VSWAYLIGDVAHEGYKAYCHNQHARHPTLTPPFTATHESKAKSDKQKDYEKQVLTPGKVPLIEDYRSVMAQRALFQGLASMGLPAFTIHSIVRYSGRALKDVKFMPIRTYGPIGVSHESSLIPAELWTDMSQLGLAAVPFLPYMFDKPVEQAVEWTFHTAFETLGGPEAVGRAPKIGREKELRKTLKPEARLTDKGEKEL